LLGLFLVAAASEEAPPAELLENFEFFKNMELMAEESIEISEGKDAAWEIDLSTVAAPVEEEKP